jgi:TRAP-type transport system periplasmic protein
MSRLSPFRVPRAGRAIRAGRLTAVAALALALALAPQATGAQAIKLGSLAPQGSSWDTALRKIAAECLRLSGGQVRITIYPGGIVGDEPDMLRKMRIGQLQAVALSGTGIGRIDPGTLSMAFPLMVRSDAELEMLLDRMSPEFEARLQANGYQLITWSAAGWLRFFSRKPIATPEDLRAQRLWMWEDNPDEGAGWAALRFPVVPLKATDVMMALQSGMVDAFSASPIAAAAFQWFAAAPNMTDIRWMPLYGAVVAGRSAWDKVPANLRPGLLASARAIAREMNAANRAGEKQAVDVMVAHGLRITSPTARDLQLWDDVVRDAEERLTGKIFDRDLLQKARQALEEMRRQ